MKLLYCHKILILIIVSLVLIVPVNADSLGRLYTSPSDRKALDKIRHTKQKIKKVEVIEIEAFIEPVELEKEIIIRDAIRLKGLVHRSDGKNAAWINDTNTFEGNLESQFIQVPNNKIKSDQATIVMPDDSTKVNLKVGEVFIPEPIERDVVETESN
jgi:hypothetical protein